MTKMFKPCFPAVLPSHNPATCHPLFPLVALELGRLYVLLLHSQPLSVWFLSLPVYDNFILEGSDDSRPNHSFSFVFPLSPHFHSVAFNVADTPSWQPSPLAPLTSHAPACQQSWECGCWKRTAGFGCIRSHHLDFSASASPFEKARIPTA